MATLLRKALVPAAIVLFLTFLALAVIRSRLAPGPGAAENGATASATQELKVGSRAPDLELKRFGEARPVRLSELKARVVLLNFWATWCDACVQEMPSIIALREAYKDRGFDVVAINVDDEPERVLPRAVRQLKIPFPVYTDIESRAADAFDVHAIPFSAMVNLAQESRLELVETGERDWNSPTLHRQLEGWLTR